MSALLETFKTKLHIGCGAIHLKDYTNVDFYDEGADWKWDLEKPFPDYIPSNFFDEILGYHVFEHLSFMSIEDVVNSWYRVLKPGGMLIMEMPDFDQTVQRYINDPNNIKVLMNVFGNQEHEGQFHKWGWNKTRLKFMLEGAGFSSVSFEPPTDYHKDLEPSLRVEAIK